MELQREHASARLIVEKITGTTLEAWYQERIFKPLGMVDTSWAVAADKQSRVATTHSRATGTLQEQPRVRFRPRPRHRSAATAASIPPCATTGSSCEAAQWGASRHDDDPRRRVPCG